MDKEILESKKQLNDYIKYYEDVCNRKGIIPIFTRSDKQAIKVLLEHIDTLENQVKKQKEVIDKAINTLEKGITFCENDSQGAYDICNIAINREKEVLDILKRSYKDE